MTAGIMTDKWVMQMAKVLDNTAALALKVFPEAATTGDDTLNACLAGEFTKTLYYELVDADGVVQEWFNGKVRLNSTEIVTDADVSGPGINGVPSGHVTDQDIYFSGGFATVELTYDTAADHDYAANDTVTVAPEAFNINGVAVTISDASFVDTIADEDA
jgi:hypothetical protein